jgi:ABC-type Fe3+/spermidine/putrescine transport system ATPase subunit
VLKLEDVHFSYGGRGVLAGVNLEAARGEVLALLGRTGSGKSTALRLLAGLEVPAKGKVLVGDQAVAGDGFTFVKPEDRRIAMVFQSLALWPHMTVAESLGFVAEPRVEPTKLESRVRGVLEELGIGHLAGRRPAQLSGGEAALAAVARALAQEPRALLLDEPFSGLDSERRAEVREMVFRLARSRGLAAVYVTHLREEVIGSADRLAVLWGGRVAQCAAPRDVYARPASAAVARLTGEAVLVNAEITAHTVVTPLGPFQRTAAPRAEELGTGWKGLVALRPENLHLAGDGSIPATVRDVEFRGGRWRLRLRATGPGEADLFVDSDRQIAAGTDVRLELRGDLPLVAAER